MKKYVEIEVVLLNDGTAEMYTGSFINQGYTRGTIAFTATMDGRRRTYNPLEAMEVAGLVKRTSDGESLFSTYKVTESFKKLFKPTFIKFNDSQVSEQKQKISEACKLAGVSDEDGWAILTKREMTNLDLFNSNVEGLANLIKKF